MDTKIKIDVKKLEIAEEKGIRGFIKSRQTRRTVIAVLIGAVAALAFYYITDAQSMAAFSVGDALKNMALGGFLGFFVTNSPCARGRC